MSIVGQHGQFAIEFPNKRYPTDGDGKANLQRDLQTAARKSGFELITTSTWTESDKSGRVFKMGCIRSRLYDAHSSNRKKESKDSRELNSSNENEPQSKADA